MQPCRKRQTSPCIKGRHLKEDILGSFDGYFAQAKLAEAEKETIPKLKQQVSDLQSVNEGLSAQITQAQLALCDVYELVIGG